MVVLPKEHGAYGQFTLPIVAAMGAAGVSIAGVALTVAAAACFVAHESAAILLGLRGPRARREDARRATRWIACCLVTAAIAGAVSLLAMPPGASWSLAVAVVPATLLALATVLGREKSWYGEALAAVAFAALAVPISMAAGARAGAAAAIAVPFALLFVTSTLAVRIVILRVRAAGDARAVRATRRSTVAIMAAGALGVGWLTAAGVFPASTLLAIAPGLLVVLAIVARPPRPARLRAVGWTLVAASVLTAVAVSI